jgi:hypothetical protein
LNQDDSTYNHTVVVDVFAGAFQDMSGLNVSSHYNLTLSLYEDIVRPSLTSAVVDFSQGVVVLTCDETIDVSTVQLNQITLTPGVGTAPSTTDSCTTDPLSLCNSTVLHATIDSPVIVVQLSENVRVRAQDASLAMGNASPLYLNVNQGALLDIAGNGVPSTVQYNTTEVVDTSSPHLLSSLIDFSTSSMVLVFNETLELTPWSSYVNLTKLFLTNAPDVHNESTDVRMTGATVMAVDGVSLHVTLTEQQRVKLLLQSAALHLDTNTEFAGDGTELYTTVEPGFVVDVRHNPSVLTLNMLTHEIDDTSVPFVNSAILHLDEGYAVIVSSETLDRTRTSTASFTFMNSVTAPFGFISLVGGTIVENNEGGDMTITLLESQRVSLIRVSGEAGGDGASVVLQTVVGGVTDLSGNPSISGGVVSVQEFPDLTPPSMTTFAIDYNDGQITMTTSETTRAGSLNLTHLFLVNSSMDYANQSLASLLALSSSTTSHYPGIGKKWTPNGQVLCVAQYDRLID